MIDQLIDWLTGEGSLCRAAGRGKLQAGGAEGDHQHIGVHCPGSEVPGQEPAVRERRAQRREPESAGAGQQL